MITKLKVCSVNKHNEVTQVLKVLINPSLKYNHYQLTVFPAGPTFPGAPATPRSPYDKIGIKNE